MSISVNVNDLKSLKHVIELKQKSNELELKIRKCAHIVKDEISKVVPKDTGELRRSLTVVKETNLRYKVATNCEYAIYVEYGTGSLGDKTAPPNITFSDEKYWAKGGAQRPKAFMRKGVKNSKIQIKKIFKE